VLGRAGNAGAQIFAHLWVRGLKPESGCAEIYYLILSEKIVSDFCSLCQFADPEGILYFCGLAQA
jgi:hypothetical protein